MAYDPNEVHAPCVVLNSLVQVRSSVLDMQKDLDESVSIQRRAEKNQIYKPTF